MTKFKTLEAACRGLGGPISPETLTQFQTAIYEYEEFMEMGRRMFAPVTAADIAKRLASMELEDDIDVFGPKILDLMRGISRDVFTELDEQPGRFNYMDDRFYMLRRVRNHEVYGQLLFENFS